MSVDLINITLTDGYENILTYSIGFDGQRIFYTSEHCGELATETVTAQIDDIEMDGNGWRDLEAGGFDGPCGLVLN